jgi:hypothetical protein
MNEPRASQQCCAVADKCSHSSNPPLRVAVQNAGRERSWDSGLEFRATSESLEEVPSEPPQRYREEYERRAGPELSREHLDFSRMAWMCSAIRSFMSRQTEAEERRH